MGKRRDGAALWGYEVTFTQFYLRPCFFLLVDCQIFLFCFLEGTTNDVSSSKETRHKGPFFANRERVRCEGEERGENLMKKTGVACGRSMEEQVQEGYKCVRQVRQAC